MFDALRSLAEEKRQARVTHAYRVVMRFGLPIRTKAEVDRFLAWMKAEGLRHPLSPRSFARFDLCNQAMTKATSIRKQRGLKFDDVSFMTSRKFYGKRTPAASSTRRRIEYALRYNPSKKGRFRGVWDAQGNHTDLD